MRTLRSIKRKLWSLCAENFKKIFYSAKRVKKEKSVKYFNQVLKSHVLENNILFVHVPKAAGTSVVNAVYKRKDWCHLTYLDYQSLFSDSQFDDLIKFAIVRNPYDRTFSAYNYLRYTSIILLDRNWAARNIRDLSFEEFVLSWLNKENVANCLVDHFKTQVSFISDRDGRIAIDYVEKLENLTENKSKLEQYLGVNLDIPHTNKSAKRKSVVDWKPGIVQRINEVYAEDFEILKYSLK